MRNIGTRPASIDPQMVEESAGSDVVNDLFEGLYTLDGNGKLQAAGALGYELDATGTAYTFKLRPDAKWSNGEPVTAADCLWLAAGGGLQERLQLRLVHRADRRRQCQRRGAGREPGCPGIKALDDYTLQITLKTRSLLPKTLSHYTTFPAPRATIEKFGREWVKPANIVSSGAFALKEWTLNERLIAERNPTTGTTEYTVLNKVIYLEIVSDTAAYNRYR